MPRASGAKERPKVPIPLPTGTVTFLFTDIEGSTQRWEARPEAMDVAVKRHDALMRNAIEQHNGYVFKTVGDSYCAAFRNPANALGAAVDAQRSFAKEDFSAVDGLRVRMGLHVGEALERDGDYFGPTLNRVARLMSIGHGGQMLLSDAMRQCVEATAIPADTSLLDLGLRRLKDLTQPEQVWQLSIAGLPSTFPPLNSLDARPNNLPCQVTSLLGRELDLEEIKSLLAKHRLLTLTGAGGVGKTRIALQVGADLIDRYPDGVWFVDLASLTNSELVSSVVARVFGISQPEGRRVDESIPPWLRNKNLLLIMDNCEHVLEAVADLSAAILETAPGVRILATSRQAINITGEFLYRLPSLAVPMETAGLKADEALHFGAVALFAERAAASNTHFHLTDENAPLVGDICRRLDGIPLAIELAGARVKVLSLANLAQRLNERFKVLTGGSRTALPRQKTLTALIDWSYELLSSREQTLFNRLGIFAGGFTIEAVSAVCAGEGVDGDEIFELVCSLADKSLVVTDTGCQPERYSLLESTRAYALEKLTTSDERERFACRHAEHFTELAMAADEASGNLSVAALLARLEPEVDNFRATLEWAVRGRHDTTFGAQLAGALEQLWYEGGLSAEGRRWIGMMLDRIAEDKHPAIAGRLWLALALLSSGKRKYESGERARLFYESVGDRHGAAHASRALARGLIQMGKLQEAGEASARALATFREFGDKQGEALCLNELADIAGDRGDVDGARDLYAQTLVTFRVLGDEAGDAMVLSNLAELDFEVGNPEQALRNAREALKIELRGKNATNIAIYQINIAAYSIALGDLEHAREAAREGLRWAQKAQSGSKLAWALQHFALLAGLRSQLQPASRLLGYVDSKYKELGLEREPTERWGYEKITELLRAKMNEEQIAKLVAEGAAWSERQAFEEALKI